MLMLIDTSSSVHSNRINFPRFVLGTNTPRAVVLRCSCFFSRPHFRQPPLLEQFSGNMDLVPDDAVKEKGETILNGRFGSLCLKVEKFVPSMKVIFAKSSETQPMLSCSKCQVRWQRRGELKKLNDQLRQINAALRRQAKIESYAPSLSYAPIGGRILENEVIVDPREEELISKLKTGKNFLRNQEPDEAFLEFKMALEMSQKLKDPVEEKKLLEACALKSQEQNEHSLMDENIDDLYCCTLLSRVRFIFKSFRFKEPHCKGRASTEEQLNTIRWCWTSLKEKEKTQETLKLMGQSLIVILSLETLSELISSDKYISRWEKD